MEWNGYSYEMFESTDERLKGKWFFRIFDKSNGTVDDPEDFPMLSTHYDSERMASEGLDRRIKALRVWECKTPEEVRKVVKSYE